MIITEKEFRIRIRSLLTIDNYSYVKGVMGPGRSGAIAATYASYILNIPFIPYGNQFQGKLMIIDTARQTGKTLNKAEKRYRNNLPVVLVCYEEPPRVTFWYEHV